MSTWDNKAINGKDLQEQVVTPLASEIKKKQDIVDAEYDDANSMIILNNVEISVAAQQ